MSILRIKIDGDWSVEDFSDLLRDMQNLSNIAYFSGIRIDGQTSAPLFGIRYRRTRLREFYFDIEEEIREEDRLRSLAAYEFMKYYVDFEESELQIRRLRYASPGLADLAGLGKIVEQMRIFMTDIMDRYLHKEDRRIARDAASQDVLSKKLANAETLLRLSEKGGLDENARRLLLGEVLRIDHKVEGAVILGKIKSVELREQ